MVFASPHTEGLQDSAYRPVADVQRSSDLALTHPEASQSDDLGLSIQEERVPSGRVFMAQMGAVARTVELEVLQAVIGAVAIDVVDDFRWPQPPSDGLLHDPAVLEHVASDSVLPDVAAGVALRTDVPSAEHTLWLTARTRQAVQVGESAGIRAEPFGQTRRRSFDRAAAPFAPFDDCFNAAASGCASRTAGRVSEGDRSGNRVGESALGAGLNDLCDVPIAEAGRRSVDNFHAVSIPHNPASFDTPRASKTDHGREVRPLLVRYLEAVEGAS